MLHENFRLINEEFNADHVLPEQMDALLELGWRHFGTHFFRYNVGFLEVDLRFVIPLRIRLKDFSFSKSQRKVLRKNQDLDVTISPAEITEEVEDLFDRHKARFDHSVPNSIFDFMSFEPATVPCEAKEIRVTRNGELVALSYFDVGISSTSGIYGMFDPAITDRSLGIFTMLKEIEYSIGTGREFYYLGYAYEGESFYDYKKRFRASEAFDWDSDWTDFSG
ncbi:MAG: arginine-tRNA-protein transferase [Blastocatellia bacterium]|nr:arginine-tRNA-protein transferase [Blastocatellia bacterium]